MMSFHWFSALLLVCSLPAFGRSAAAAEPIDFAHEIVPILKQHCAKCHTGQEKKGRFSLNTRASLLAGGESGAAVVPGKSEKSELIQRLTSDDKDLRMPPEGARVPAAQLATLKRWIDDELPWEEGFTFGARGYEPPLKPRRVELPPVVDGRTNSIDRIIDHYLAAKKLPRPAKAGDEALLRRASMDLVGLLPTLEERAAFLKDPSADKRQKLVRSLLARDQDYAEHWLTFWNDLLRNDYSGTGFITGGRRQVTKWLYGALLENKPFDQFARELVAPPTPESSGYGAGIQWRGDVSAGQTVEVQFAQSVTQTFLGINLKCASCHDSFIDRWKLEESYALAAVYSNRPLEIHRCDVPTGKMAQAGWLFPELGQVDAKASQPERLKQLAGLLTHPENGRFTRTIVNRLWHRLMGRGIVHPTDAMQTEPWNSDLLDYLASHLAENGYDLKTTLELIATSEAYQSQIEAGTKRPDEQTYAYSGPRAKRLTAEQFVDAVWQVTGTAPAKFDAPVLRGKGEGPAAKEQPLAAKWIWDRADAAGAAAGESIAFRRKFKLREAPRQAVAAVTCDNSYVLYANGQKVQAGDNWQEPNAVPLTTRLKAGENEIVIVATNGGAGPNPAGLICELRAVLGTGEIETIGTDNQWQWTKTLPGANGKFKEEPTDWQAAAPVAQPEVWAGVLPQLAAIVSRGAGEGATKMVRASLVKSDFLMRTLGRPNRDQIVSVRPSELSTLEAMDLSNGPILADLLARGAKSIVGRPWESPEEFTTWLYQTTLARDPTDAERAALKESFGEKLTAQGVEDALWTVLMLPEFQMVR